MCVVVSQNVDEIGGSSRLGLGKDLGPLQHHFNLFSKMLGEVCLGSVFDLFGALVEASGVTDVQHGLPGCE